MPRPANIISFSILLLSWITPVHAQDSSSAVSHIRDLKTVVVAKDTKSDWVIAVPPATSVSFNLRDKKKAPSADTVDLPNWLSKEAGLNGLQSASLLPWHIVVTYDQFDEDGDNVHSGVYEEYWAGAKKA